jgi:serine/threonine-protein kinase RsbW
MASEKGGRHNGKRQRTDAASGPAVTRSTGNMPLKATIISDFSSDFREVQRQIIDAAEKNGYQDQCLFAIKIALEEALVNAIKHGNKLDKNKHVTIEAQITPLVAEITIEDEGPGFRRSDVPDPLADENLEKPSGRGILLIESYMSEVRWDHGGRRLRMIKNRGDSGNPACMRAEG